MIKLFIPFENFIKLENIDKIYNQKNMYEYQLLSGNMKFKLTSSGTLAAALNTIASAKLGGAFISTESWYNDLSGNALSYYTSTDGISYTQNNLDGVIGANGIISSNKLIGNVSSGLDNLFCSVFTCTTKTTNARWFDLRPSSFTNDKVFYAGVGGVFDLSWIEQTLDPNLNNDYELNSVGDVLRTNETGNVKFAGAVSLRETLIIPMNLKMISIARANELEHVFNLMRNTWGILYYNSKFYKARIQDSMTFTEVIDGAYDVNFNFSMTEII